MDKNFNILNKKRFLTAETKLPLKSIERIVKNIDIQLKEMAITKEDILGIGISCGGPLNSREGVILSPPNLPGSAQTAPVSLFLSCRSSLLCGSPVPDPFLLLFFFLPCKAPD